MLSTRRTLRLFCTQCTLQEFGFGGGHHDQIDARLHACQACMPVKACQVPCHGNEKCYRCRYTYTYSYSCHRLQSNPLLGLEYCHLVQVLDVIHHLDVLETLISDGTSTPEDWAWVKQLRNYKTGRAGNAAVLVKMADAALEYSWEYQGNAPKLVYTPLTDRCYLTLTQVRLLPHNVATTSLCRRRKLLCFIFDSALNQDLNHDQALLPTFASA